MMAASLTGPEWEEPTDPSWWKGGVSMIEQVASLPQQDEIVPSVYF